MKQGDNANAERPKSYNEASQALCSWRGREGSLLSLSSSPGWRNTYHVAVDVRTSEPVKSFYTNLSEPNRGYAWKRIEKHAVS